jgi:hypothetical protein
LTWRYEPSLVPATGSCGKAAPAEIQCIPAHRPAGAGPTLGLCWVWRSDRGWTTPGLWRSPGVGTSARLRATR